MFPNISGIGPQWHVGADGWTVFAPSKDSTIIYCSAAGGTAGTAGSSSDTYDGLSPVWTSGTHGPVKTPSVAYAKIPIRNFKPDWLLFRNGDTFTNPSLSSIYGGRSSKELMLFGGYSDPSAPSTARPILMQTTINNPLSSWIQNGGSNIAYVGLDVYAACLDPNSTFYQGCTIVGDTTAGSNVITNVATIPATVVVGYGVFGSGVSNFTVASIGSTSITCNAGQNATYTATQIPIQIITRDAHDGISMGGVLSTAMFEDCKFRFCGVSLGGSTVGFPFVPQVTFNRCIFISPWSVGGGACSFVAFSYNDGTGFTKWNECVLHHGGWNEQVWAAGANKFKHNLYLHDPSVPYNLTGCINSYGSATGAQHRDGGTDYNNLWISNPTAEFGVAETNNWTVSNSVFTNGNDIIGGYRAATTAHSSGTRLDIDGLCGDPNNLPTNAKVANLSNPNSIPSGTTITAINSDGKSATLSSAIVLGQRGDGIQVGDNLVFFIAPNGLALQTLTVGVAVSAGPITVGSFNLYIGPTTVSVSGTGSACIVTETTNNARSAGDPFQFTSGSLPPELALSTTYYALDTGLTYRISATSGGSPITTSGGGTSGVARTGARLFFFNQPLVPNSPPLLVPSWVTVGMKVEISAGGVTLPSAFSGSSTTVAQIAPDNTWLITTDPLLLNMAASGQSTFIFDGPNHNSFVTRFGPNNIILNSRTALNDPTIGVAIDIQNSTFNVDASGNYVYNWGNSTGNANLTDENTLSPYKATNNLSQTLNVSGSTLYPKASIEAYDATLTNNQFTASIAPVSGSPGCGILTVTAGTPPIVGDYIFDLNFAGLVPARTYVNYISSGGVIYVAQYGGSISASVASTTMINGSDLHFINQAALNSKNGGWDTRYTAAAGNNFIRTAMGLATI